MRALLNVSYFLVLICVGDFILLMGLTPVLTGLPDAAVALGFVREADYAKVALYLLVSVVWTGVLIWLWVRHKSLVPTAIKPGYRPRYLLGHAMVLLGHATLLGIFFVEAMKWLMILPVLVILGCYFAGVVLIEISRQRAGPPIDPAGDR